MLTCFIYAAPSARKVSRFGYSVGCLTLATMAKQRGEVLYYDFSLEKYPAEAEQRMLGRLREAALPWVVVYFDSVPLHRSSNVAAARKLCATIRTAVPSARIIACGPACMTSRQHVPFSDITIVDEPEASLVAILGGEQNGHCLTSGTDSRPRADLLDDLAVLPAPDRTLLPDGAEFAPSNGVEGTLCRSAVVTTSRGCTGACRFCPRRAWSNGRLRHRPLEHVVEEIGGLISNGYRNIWLDDDNMGADPEWSCILFDRIATLNRDQRCGLYVSAWGNVPSSFFEHAAAAGVRIVSFGVESASDRVLRYYGKPISLDTMRRAICAADKAGIFTVANVIIGAPCEEETDLASTLSFLTSAPIDDANIKILSYIRGSILWDQAHSRGLIKESDDCVFADGLMGTSNRPFHVLVEQQKNMIAAFIKNPNRLSRLRTKMLSRGVPYSI